MYRFLVAISEPFTLLYLLTAVGLLMLWRRRKKGANGIKRILVPFAVLGALSTPAVGHLMLGTLEWWYPPDSEIEGDAEAIVAISGLLRSPEATLGEAELGADTMHRSLHAANLLRQGKAPLLVLSGGRVDPHTTGPTLAEAMRDFLVGCGVQETDLLLENQSVTTYENAVATSELLSRRGIHKIILVTSAAHMPRAVRCFRALGLEVTPATCYYQAGKFDWSPTKFLPSPRGAMAAQEAAHEWAGMLWYWLLGRI